MRKWIKWSTNGVHYYSHVKYFASLSKLLFFHHYQLVFACLILSAGALPWSTAALSNKPVRKRKRRKWLIWRVWWNSACLLLLALSSFNAPWTSSWYPLKKILIFKKKQFFWEGMSFIYSCVYYCNRWLWKRFLTLQPPTFLRHV